MSNTIQNKPTCISAQDIRQLAQQGQTRALNARNFANGNLDNNASGISNLAEKLANSVVAGGKTATPSNPSLAGGKPVQPQAPIIAGGKSVNPPIIGGMVPLPPSKPVEPPVLAGMVAPQPPVIAGLIAQPEPTQTPSELSDSSKTDTAAPTC
jgi:hypothetical protein